MMPFITPADLISYSVIEIVKTRDETLLAQDILEAEAEVKAFVGHDFSDPEKYSTLPAEVKLATLKLSQYYSLVNADESVIKSMTSEKIGDYQYSKGQLVKPEVTHLLSPFRNGAKTTSGDGNTTFRMRLI
jgi:hypothetical protein